MVKMLTDVGYWIEILNEFMRLIKPCIDRFMKMNIKFLIFGLVLFVWVANGQTDIDTCTNISIPGIYHLNQSINTAASNCINISANDVYLDGSGYTISGGGNGDGIIVSSYNVTINNMNITNWNNGITINGSNNILTNNSANSNDGIVPGSVAPVNGIGIKINGNNSILTNNSANSNYGLESSDGIGIEINGYNNTLTNNSANSNQGGCCLVGNFGGGFGIIISGNNNTLLNNSADMNGNVAVGSGLGIDITGNNNTLLNNSADMNAGSCDLDRPAGGSGIVISGNNNTLLNNSADMNEGTCYFIGGNSSSYGIILTGNNNTLIYNLVNSNIIGIFIRGNNSTLINNMMSLNEIYGIYLYGSSNIIYNNYFNNSNNYFNPRSGYNILNTTKRNGTNIIGGPFLGGNFWDNPNGTGFSHTCIDSNRDQICDSAYGYDTNNTDMLPLKIYPKSIIISPTTAYIAEGGFVKFNATTLDQNNNPIPGINLSWSVINSSVGNITPLFSITGNDGNASTIFNGFEPGNTTVSASDGFNVADAKVTVFQTLKYIKIRPAKSSLGIGKTQMFNATALDQDDIPIAGINISWSVSNSSVGNITPLFSITGNDGIASTTFESMRTGNIMLNATNGAVNGNSTIMVWMYPLAGYHP